jgi:hypothetical protein
MALREIEYAAAKIWELRGELPRVPFATVDPGVDGAVVAYRDLGLTVHGLPGKPALVFPLAAGLGHIGPALVRAGVRFLVVENQHGKMNQATALKLARGAGMIPAFVAGVYAGTKGPRAAVVDPVTCMWIHPATWQNALRAMEGKRKRLESGDGKRLAKLYGEQVLDGDGRYVGATKAQRGGILDAVAMAIWVQRVLYMPAELKCADG